MSSLHNFETDLLQDWRELQAMLAEQCIVNDQGCLIFPHAMIMVRLRGYRERRGVSPARVAWALANTTDHLGKHDYAVHRCQYAWSVGEWDQRVCCTPEHIVKGTRADVALMRSVRKRGLILEGGR